MTDEIVVADANQNRLGELCERAGVLIQGARSYIGQMSNYATVLASFELGRYIVEEEQNGQDRAAYGTHVLDVLSAYLTERFGRGFSRRNVASMRKFYLAFRDRESQIVQSPIAQLGAVGLSTVAQSPTGQSRAEDSARIWQSAIAQSEANFDSRPFKLSWTHYQTLMRIEDRDERDFYELEAIRECWSVKTLQRQYGSSLYERLALSRDKDEVMRLAREGSVPQKPEDLLKSSYVLEFAGLEDRAVYHESELESAVVDKIQDFLMEMGTGFLFEKRQRRFSFQDRDYFLDLALYNRHLRCYVLVDFKADLLEHQDLGQMLMYVNYYDRYVRLQDENPTVGILLCKGTDEALVQLTLPEDSHIYAREYQLYLPDKKLLQQKLTEWLEESDIIDVD